MPDFRKYKILYGLPHCHSIYSTGSESPTKILDGARDSGLDFAILCDCNSSLLKEVKLKSSKVSKWTACEKACKSFIKKYKDFIPLYGFDASFPNHCHFNIVGSKTFFSNQIEKFNFFMVWLWINHPLVFISSLHNSSDSIPYSSFLNGKICLIDIGNGNFNGVYTRSEKSYYSMLDNGWTIGAINSQDNYKKSLGISDNVTAVLSKDYSSSSLLDSLEHRRTYSTESRTLRLYYSINDSIIGDIIEVNDNESLNFVVKAYDNENTIEKIEIISSSGTVIRSKSLPGEKKLSYFLKLKAVKEEPWYIVRISQKGNRVAVSSPIFVRIK